MERETLSSRVGESPIDSRVAINKLADNSCPVIVVGVKMATSFWLSMKGWRARRSPDGSSNWPRRYSLPRAVLPFSILRPPLEIVLPFFDSVSRIVRLSFGSVNGIRVENTAFPSVLFSFSRRKRSNRKQVATVLDDKTIARVPLEIRGFESFLLVVKETSFRVTRNDRKRS